MSIFKKPFKIFNGKSWDEYHLKTDSTQVVHTKQTEQIQQWRNSFLH